MSDRVPSYRRHKQSGQAIVTLTDGLGHRKDVLLGKWESLDHYTGHRISCSMAGESPRERADNKQTQVTRGMARQSGKHHFSAGGLECPPADSFQPQFL